MNNENSTVGEKLRRIIHFDLDAFFCAVEEKYNHSLRGKPFAVGGSPEGRGVVASCSYAARRYGVRSAMPMARALRLCPNLIVLRSRHGEYSKESQEVMKRLRAVTDLVQQISIDEAFLDVTNLAESAEMIAHRLQKTIREELSLPCSIGLASNKLVAKIATDVGKLASRGVGPPNAMTIVPPGTEADFLAPLPVEMLWGVGPKTAERLERIGVITIGDLAQIPEIELANIFGKHGWDLARRAKGIDNSPIVTFRQAKSISNETTFSKDVSDRQTLYNRIDTLSESVAKRLKKHGLQGKTVKIKLRWSDFTTLTRQMTLFNPTADYEEIYHAAIKLVRKVWQPGKAVRLVGVGVSGLEDKPKQLSLWDVNRESEEKFHRVQEAIKTVHERFGKDALTLGFHGKNVLENNRKLSKNRGHLGDNDG
ncbi:MAG TPA: DNA polymerase IV [Anaerolineae bacterium]|nr:DNA polymerase IV [Anaerolineae bacterium]